MLTVTLAREVPSVAAAWTALATLAALRRVLWPAGLAALPALFAALPPVVLPAAALPPGPVQLTGTVIELRRDPLRGEQAILVETLGGRLWLHTDLAVDALPGDRLQATARCSEAAIPGDPGSVRAAGEACAIAPGPISLPRLCAAARRAIERRLARLLPGAPGAVLTTLVLGNGTRLPGDVAAAHRATGLSHLLAVSGAHAAMLACLLGLQPFGGGRRRPVGRRHLLLALGLLFLYGALTGFEPPVFRALGSYALVAASLQLGRRVGAVQGLAWPALLSAIVAPAGVLGPSFCLSYAAVAGLALAGGAANGSRVQVWVLAPIRASLWATVTTAPWTLFWFGQLAPWTIVLTPVLAPLVGILLFLGLGGTLLTWLVPGVEALVSPVLSALTTTYIDCVTAADGLPGTPVFATTAPPLPLLLAGAASALLVLLVFRNRRGAVLACAIACLPHFAPTATPAPSLRLFAVGHGQACLITLATGRTMLIDCGSMQHGSLPAHKVERALHRRRIDLLVLTHGDCDHIGAVAELLQRLPVDAVVLPAALADSEVHRALAAAGSRATFLAPGDRWCSTLGVSIAAPTPEQPSSNDESLWIRVALPGLQVLASGDAEEGGVRAAIAEGLAGPADVLVLPHHGRSNACGAALLDAVAPRLCLASNRQGEGCSALGELALQRRVATFATAVVGDITIECGQPGTNGPAHLLLPGGLQIEARDH